MRANDSPASTVETRTAVNSVDRGVDGGILLDAGGGNFAFHADAFGRKSQRLQHPELSVSVRPDAAGQRPPAEFGDAGGRRDRSAAPTSSRTVSSALRSRRTTRSIASPASTAPITRPGSTAIRPSSPPRANTGRMPRRSTPSASGPAPPTITTTRSGLPIPPIPRPSASGRPSPTRSRKAASKCR